MLTTTASLLMQSTEQLVKRKLLGLLDEADREPTGAAAAALHIALAESGLGQLAAYDDDLSQWDHWL